MDISKYKSLYLQETHEHLSGIEKGLLELEKGPQDQSSIDNLFRHYHSIKGMSASMGYENIARLAHAQEDLLDRLRSNRLKLSPAMLPALLQCTDALKELIKSIEEDLPPTTDVSPFVEKIKGIIEGRNIEAPIAPAQIAPLTLSKVMKVDGKVFDDLLATVGDLFMSLSSFKALFHNFRSIALKDGVHMLGKSINTLYDNILSARMLPIRDLTEGLPRVIRDISRETGKEVALKIEGAEISMDRTILEGLGSPLVHIIRNAVDHGIEPLHEREGTGKPPEGSIIIKAYNKKDRVIIEVSDDGKGMDREKIKAKALSKGIPEERIRAMSDEDTLMLTCLPGLSVSEKITDISGRGVGMDVVKTSVEGLGGALHIESIPGKGTKIIMELPRTASIIKALFVNVGPELFLLPISRIEQVLEADKKELSGETITYCGAEIPLISLDKTLGIEKGPGKGLQTVLVVEKVKQAATEEERKNLVGIKVDGFGDEIDAYIKPLLPPISKLWGVSGITIMSDGRPVFLLDLNQIISKALAKEA